MVSSLNKRGRMFFSLENDDIFRLVGSDLDGLVNHGFIGDKPVRLDPARSGQNDLGPGIVNPGRQFTRGKSAKNDRMDGPDPCAGHHGKNSFGDHGHINNDPITFLDAKFQKHRGKCLDLGE